MTDTDRLLRRMLLKALEDSLFKKYAYADQAISDEEFYKLKQEIATLETSLLPQDSN